MNARRKLIPSAPLSPAANHEVFGIPYTNAGNAVCRFHIVWGVVQDHVQPCIFSPLVHYYGFRPATHAEVNDVLKRRNNDEQLYPDEMELYL